MKLNDKSITLLVPNYIGGGAEKITDTIFKPLMQKYGYKVHLISVEMNERTRPRAAAVGYEVTDLTAVGPDFTSPRATDAILDAIKATDSRYVVYVGMAPEAIERYRKELSDRIVVFHLHTMPGWQAKVRIYATRRVARALDSIPKLIEWYLVKYLKERYLKVYTRRFGRRYRKVYKNVDSVILLTDTYRKQMAKMVGVRANSPKARLSTLYNPFDPTELLPLASHPKKKEILYLGRLHCIEKGIEHLLRAWKTISEDYPDWKLKIVGEGPDKPELEYLIEVLSIRNVEFYPYSKDIGEHLSTASILCLTSNMEGWPTVLMEAMAAGVVPVAFNCCGGVEEMLRDGRGILVKPGCDRKFGRELARLIDNPGELEKRRKLYPDFVKKFPADEAVDKFHSLLINAGK